MSPQLGLQVQRAIARRNWSPSRRHPETTRRKKAWRWEGARYEACHNTQTSATPPPSLSKACCLILLFTCCISLKLTLALCPSGTLTR